MQLKQERESRKWTQKFVAEKIGVSQQSIQQFELNQTKPSYDVLVKLENLFEKTHRELFAVASDAPISPKNNNKL